jgi:hypothetical protein
MRIKDLSHDWWRFNDYVCSHMKVTGYSEGDSLWIWGGQDLKGVGWRTISLGPNLPESREATVIKEGVVTVMGDRDDKALCRQ